MKLTVLIISLLFSFQIYASDNDEVAKVMILRGEVSATLPDGQSFLLEEGQWLPEGATVSTSNRSFVKFLFIDRSQMNLAPNSEMTIETFNDIDPGMINLARGRLRSKVTRNYLDDADESEDSKLFIRTKNAAMGVRGTDFMVGFNPSTDNTSLLTFQGSVAMVNIESTGINIRDPRALDAQLNSQNAIRVNQGQASAVKAGSTPAPPRELDQSAIERADSDPSLKMDDEEITTSQTEEEATSSSSNKRSRIPPGMDEETFTSDSSATEEALGEEVSSMANTIESEEVQRSPASVESPEIVNQPETMEIDSMDGFEDTIADTNFDDIIEDTRRDQDEFIQETTEETIAESMTQVRFILERIED